MIKIESITQLYTDKLIPAMISFSLQQKLFLYGTGRTKTEHKSHSSPIKNTPDKLSSVLNNRTLRDIPNLLDPYKRNPSEAPITTLTSGNPICFGNCN